MALRCASVDIPDPKHIIREITLKEVVDALQQSEDNCLLIMYPKMHKIHSNINMS